MRKATLLLAPLALVLGLTGCETRKSRSDDVSVLTGPDPCKVNVRLDRKRNVYVDQEPTRTNRCVSTAATRVVNFYLRGSPGATFEVSVTSGPAPRPTCIAMPAPHGQPEEVACTFVARLPGQTPQEYKYAVKVVDGINPPPPTLDPMMIND